MKNPLLVGRAIRAQLENEVPQDLPLERDFREDSDYTITDQYVSIALSSIPEVPDHSFTTPVTSQRPGTPQEPQH